MRLRTDRLLLHDWIYKLSPINSTDININATNMSQPNTTIADPIASTLLTFHYFKQPRQRQLTRHSNIKHTDHAITIFPPTMTHYQMPKQPSESSHWDAPIKPIKSLWTSTPCYPFNSISAKKVGIEEENNFRYKSTNKLQKQVQLPSAS